jgi:RHS repeat-associated protein
MTGWQGEISLTTSYVLDLTQRNGVLTANASGNLTFYLYGNSGPLAELTTSWAYYLTDGTNTPRQMTDATGEVTLARSYTPWGEVRQQVGTGSFTWGYFGGLMDAATGLVYVGGGQYYDPATGRFLTPVNRDGTNPYVPQRGGDPLGAVLAPFALLALLGGRKRRGKYDRVILMLVLMVAVGGALVACDGQSTPTNSGPTTPANGTAPTVPPTNTKKAPTSTPAPSKTSAPIQAATATPSQTASPTVCPLETILTDAPPQLTIVKASSWKASKERYIRIVEQLKTRDPGALELESGAQRLTDKTVLAFIIGAEFDNILRAGHSMGNQVLAALTNQYHGSVCGGNCGSALRHVAWLTTMEGWYSTSHSDELLIARYKSYETQAQGVIDRAYPGRGFWWANYKPDSLMDKFIENKGAADWWPNWWAKKAEEAKNNPSLDPFGRYSQPPDPALPYVDHSEDAIFVNQGVYDGFVVLTGEQNTACGEVKCLGF